MMYGSTSPKPAAWPVRGVTRPIFSVVSPPPPPPLCLTPPHAASTPLDASVRPVPPARIRNDRRDRADSDDGRVVSGKAMLLSGLRGPCGIREPARLLLWAATICLTFLGGQERAWLRRGDLRAPCECARNRSYGKNVK